MSSSSNTVLLCELLTTSVAHLREHGPELMLYLHIILAALFPIYTGAHASLSRPSSAAKSAKARGSSANDDDVEEEASQVMEGLSASDAIVFPITAGLMLATLYWLIKRYGADMINVIMAWYFAGTGIFSVAKLFSDTSDVCQSYVFPGYYEDDGLLFKIQGKEKKAVVLRTRTEHRDRLSPLPGALGRVALPLRLQDMLWRFRLTLKQKYTVEAYIKALLDTKGDFTVLDFAGLLVGLVAVAYNSFIAKPWWLTNIQGFAVSYVALQLISPTSFGIGSLVLAGLFFYDIWAVFFTPLMITVATNLDQPIKLLFPRADGGFPNRAYSMLGLGDIVLPGLMVGLALRFDLFMFYARKQGKTKSRDSKADAVTEKAPYTAVKGHWGSIFWTRRVVTRTLPSILRNAAFPKPYFTAAMLGYTIGMIATLAIMSFFQHAQPALLYLVPAVLLSLWGTAAVRGELQDMWAYSEELTGEALAEAKQDDKTNLEATQGDAAHWWTAIKHMLNSSKDVEAEVAAPNAEGRSIASTAKAKASQSGEHATTAASEPGILFSITLKRREAVKPLPKEIIC